MHSKRCAAAVGDLQRSRSSFGTAFWLQAAYELQRPAKTPRINIFVQHVKGPRNRGETRNDFVFAILVHMISLTFNSLRPYPDPRHANHLQSLF